MNSLIHTRSVSVKRTIAYANVGGCVVGPRPMTETTAVLKTNVLGRVSIRRKHRQAMLNALTPLTVGRKNWLFIGLEESGGKAAIFYILIGNCRHFGIDPHAPLKDVLEKLPNGTNQAAVELLSAN